MKHSIKKWKREMNLVRGTAVTLGALLLLTGCTNKKVAFSEAYDLYQNGQYEEALVIFDTLENFRGADQLADECRELIAGAQAGATSGQAGAESGSENGQAAGMDAGSQTGEEASQTGENQGGEDQIKENQPSTSEDQSGQKNGEGNGAENEKMATVLNNNGHFVQVGETVYFHIPDADNMDKTALWADYSDRDCGRTILCAYDLASNQVSTAAYDYASGFASLQGGVLYSLGCVPVDGQVYSETNLIGFDCEEGKQKEILSEMDGILLGADLSGTYIVTYHQDYVDYEDVKQVFVLKDGVLQNTIDDARYCTSVKLGNQKLFYICETPDNTYSLRQLDLNTGERMDLGVLPDLFTIEWYGYVDECLIVEDSIYFTYSAYEGTGHFFAEGYYVQAKIGEENSLQFEEMPKNLVYEELRFAPFAVVDGKMMQADGEPGTCDVQEDGELGYFDETGTWQPVAKGWGDEFLTEDDDYKGVELAEKIGDFIYLFYNSNHRVPEEDVGWRYAYCRDYVDVYRISVKSGEATLLMHQAAPWCD